MKNFAPLVVSLGWLVLAASPAQANFSSLQIFGDGISTTTNNPFAGQYYYGLRRSNGRVWVEVLAQRLGLGANSITNVNWSNSSNNCSYYGQYSSLLAPLVNQYVAPPDVGSALHVVWVNNADFVNDMSTLYQSPSTKTNVAAWTAANTQSLSNHYNIVTNLYSKGVRTLLMPNAVDITEVPAYNNLQVNDPATRNFIRQQVVSFNAGFATMLNTAQMNCPGLIICSPDFFTLLDKVLTNAAAYGLTNKLSASGVSLDAYDDLSIANLSLSNNPGPNYIFWDGTDPTAKFHEIIADVALETVAPVQVGKMVSFAGSNRLDMVNVPVGLSGFVDSQTNVVQTNWSATVNITSTNTAQSVFVPMSGPQQFYRLRFPYAWSWP